MKALYDPRQAARKEFFEALDRRKPRQHAMESPECALSGVASFLEADGEELRAGILRCAVAEIIRAAEGGES